MDGYADQLAEPVSDVPRILEVPDIAPAAPALGGITIEAAERQQPERRPGIDLPLQTASLQRRMAAGNTSADSGTLPMISPSRSSGSWTSDSMANERT